MLTKPSTELLMIFKNCKAFEYVKFAHCAMIASEEIHFTTALFILCYCGQCFHGWSGFPMGERHDVTKVDNT